MADLDVLFQLIRVASVKNVRSYLKAYPEAATVKEKNGYLPLHLAVINSNRELVRMILEAYPQAAAKKTNDGENPLHIAARNSNPKVVELILKANPEAIYVKDKYGNTPLDNANTWNTDDVIKVLKLALEKYMDSVPPEYICPITSDVMKDPVVADDGNSYERAAIERWFQSHSTSPLTNVVLVSNKIVPNRALKSLIDSYMGN